MDWKLEVVIVPVADVDRAKEFYADKLGFPVDVDHEAGEAFRIVQITPPGSACSIIFGKGVGSDVTPGSVKGNQFVVSDIEAAHAHLRGPGHRQRRDRPLRGRRHGSGTGPGAAEVRLVHLLRRPGRQHLGGPGGRAECRLTWRR